jgi:hypothetical protein
MYLQKVISKKTYTDAYQNVTDPEHWQAINIATVYVIISD